MVRMQSTVKMNPPNYSFHLFILNPFMALNRLQCAIHELLTHSLLIYAQLELPKNIHTSCFFHIPITACVHYFNSAEQKITNIIIHNQSQLKHISKEQRTSISVHLSMQFYFH